MAAHSGADRWGRETDPRGNALLARLPAAEYEQVVARLVSFTAEIKHPVYEEGGLINYVYFPVDAVFSLVTTIDGSTIEVSTVGNEGMLGLPAYLGAVVSPDDSFCQIPGRALSMSVGALHELLASGGQLQHLLSLHTQAIFVQLSQNIACNRLHSAELRAARWLLMSHDRVASDEFTLTHEFLAQMLGVRRATVTDTAKQLRRRGLIDYERGRIAIQDRSGLEKTACECYHRIRNETDRLLGSEVR